MNMKIYTLFFTRLEKPYEYEKSWFIFQRNGKSIWIWTYILYFLTDWKKHMNMKIPILFFNRLKKAYGYENSHFIFYPTGKKHIYMKIYTLFINRLEKVYEYKNSYFIFQRYKYLFEKLLVISYISLSNLVSLT